MEVLLGISIIANVAFAYLLVSQNKDHAKERQSMLAESQSERSQLLNRIQAPETQVALSMNAEQEGLLNTRFDDDDDFRKSMAAVERLEQQFGVVSEGS